MERFDVSEGARLAEMVEVARSGEDVVITAAGEEVARLTVPPSRSPDRRRVMNGPDLVREINELRKELPPAVFKIDWSNAVREMRDEDRF